MKNPLRDLPRVINSAMAVVISGFVLMNVALYIVLLMAAIRERDTVAVVRPTDAQRLVVLPHSDDSELNSPRRLEKVSLDLSVAWFTP